MKFEDIQNNILLEYLVGSHLYGTNTPESDLDYSGVFVAPLDYYFGLKEVKEIDLSFKSKDENGKNNADAIDRRFYDIKRFVKLASDCNPTIIEQLFVDEKQLKINSPMGIKLLEHRHDFLHKGLYHRFLGYAYSQKKKMIVKLGNHKEFEFIKGILEKADPTDTLLHLKSDISKYFDKEHLRVGDIKIPLGVLNKKALSIVNKRFSNMSHRKELIRKHGYDLKFASHLIRLTLEGIELLETCDLIFPLKDKDLLLSIKKGDYNLNEILGMFDDLEENIKIALEKTDLPKYSDFKKLNNLTMEIIGHYHDKR